MKLVKMANPIAVTRAAYGLGGAVVGVADSVARRTLQVVVARVSPEPEPNADAQVDASTEDVTVRDVPPGPTIVMPEPHAPEQPPVDVVGRALADEAAELDDEVAAGLEPPQ